MAGRDLFADKPEGRDLFAEPPTATDQAIGYIEPALTFASGLVAEPAAGIAGLGAMGVNEIYNFFRNGGRPTVDVATDTINATRDALTYQPRTELGQENLQAVGETLAPVAETIQDIEQGAGDIGYKLGGDSPVMGAIGKTIPTAVVTALGFKPVRSAVKTATGIKKASSVARKVMDDKAVNKTLYAAAPDAPLLKDTASNIFTSLDESGAVINADKITKLANDLTETVTKKGYHPKLQPSVKVTLDEFDLLKGKNISVGKLNQLREFATSAASNIDPKTKMLGVNMLNKIDNMMEKLKPSDFSQGGVRAGEQYKLARDLWGRSKRSEMMSKAVADAENAASGTENGIRIEVRKILRSDKKSRFFTKDELKEMRKIADGTFAGNLAKAIGKFGFSIDKATNTVGGTIGAAGGAAAFGAPGMVVVPTIGTVSKQLAKVLTMKNAKFADSVIRAGKNGRKITRLYMERVPKAEQSPKLLAELLVNQKASLERLRNMPLNSLNNKQRFFVKDAIFYADMMRQGQSSDELSGHESAPQ